METKSFSQIKSRIKSLKFLNKLDLVVGIGYGGIIPACLIAQYFNIPLELVWINFRGKDNRPQNKTPVLKKPITFIFKDKRILLVDDRSKSGATLAFAQILFKEAKSVHTLAFNGKADYSLFNEDCFIFPWHL